MHDPITPPSGAGVEPDSTSHSPRPTPAWKTRTQAPPPSDRLALFLDFDGTLVEIAATPGSVVVPPDLKPVLAAARRVLDGAVCIVSGRILDDLERFFTGLDIPLIAEHGAVSSESGMAPATGWPCEWRARLERLADQHPGVLIEEKAQGVAIHYRLAPEAAAAALAAANGLIAGDPAAHEVLPGKMVYEVKQGQTNKGRAVARMMQEPPFRGRIPVYVGDDVTDEAAFAAVEAAGGIALHVGIAFAGMPERVRVWLAGFAELDVTP